MRTSCEDSSKKKNIKKLFSGITDTKIKPDYLFIYFLNYNGLVQRPKHFENFLAFRPTLAVEAVVSFFL